MVSAKPFDADVAIIGYGPSGVSAALPLARDGIKTIAFERERGIYQRARAVTVNDWTMRCFQSVGLDQELARGMDPTHSLRWMTYDRHELLRTGFPPSSLGEHPVSYSIYQPVMEEALRRGAERHAKHLDVRFGQEVTGIEQDDDGVTIISRDLQSGATTTTRARYALACDGGSSVTRERLGVKMIGETVETQWVIVDARVKRWWPDRHILTMWSDKKRPVVDVALGLGNHRWEFPLEPHESERDFTTHEDLWKLLIALGITKDDVEIHQHAFYRHHVRHAERWRVGRVFLLGDAAHLMPPWAGAGMQSGIRDAFNLTWKLREVLTGRLPESLLDTFEVERAPDVAFYTGVSVHLGRVIKQQLTSDEMAAMAPKPGEPPPEPPLLRAPQMVAGWLRGEFREGSAVGRMLPQPRVADARGRLSMLDDLIGNGFVLLGDNVDPANLLTPAEKAGWDALGARYLAVLAADQRGQHADDIVDINGTLLAWLRAHGTRAVAVRPDRFVAAAAGSGLGIPHWGDSVTRQPLAAELVDALGDELYAALVDVNVVSPLSERYPDITIADAYRIQQRLNTRRVASGEKIIGTKIGVTSEAVMNMLGVRQPDFGMLTDAMRCVEGQDIDARTLIQPKAEGEIGFLLKNDLKGPGVTEADVLAATGGVMACFEIVDSRVRDWKIKIQDTVADNASCGIFVLSERLVDPGQVDLLGCQMKLYKNGELAVTGTGAATMGSPLTAVAWLANTMGALGTTLKAGEVVLSGALGAMLPVKAGDQLRMDIEGIGGCSVRFV